MSYSHRESATISGSATASYSYPASQNGGSGSVTVHWSEPINIIVKVEDDPFQSSVHSCRGHVDAMTASVAATETAQLVSKAANAKKVATAITDGFNGLIYSEISQQMTELESIMPPKMQEMKALVDRCVGLRQQMERDFLRIGDRYQKVFSDLNSELERRIRNLDRRAFSICEDVAAKIAFGSGSNAVIRTILGSAEQNQAVSCIQSHRIRQRAFGMVESARKHLHDGSKLISGLAGIQDDVSTNGVKPLLLPIAVAEFDDESGNRKLNVFTTSGVGRDDSPRSAAIKKLVSERVKWAPIDGASRERLEDRLKSRMIAGTRGDQGERAAREAAMMQKLWAQMSPNAPIGGAR